MSQQSLFENAVTLIDSGDTAALRELLTAHPELVQETDDDNTTLLVRLIDWPGNAAESARALLEVGVNVDARRDERNGTALAGALCMEELDVIEVLLEFGADIHAECGWREGTVLDLADEICQNQNRVNDDKIRRISELVSKASGRTIPSRPPIGSTTPVLFVDDVDEGIKYYQEKLGFRLNWEHESECGKYVCVGRGSSEFHMTVCNCDDNGHVGKLSVRVECGNVDPLFEEFRDAGVKIRTEPANEPWGLREFEIEDLAGNWLTFFNFIED